MCVSILMESYFPSESTLPLSGEINANKGSREDGRSEKNEKKMAEKRKTNKGLYLREEKKRAEVRGENGMRMPIKVGNWSPLLLSIPLVPIFP